MEALKETALEPFIEKELERFEIKKEDLQAFVKTFDGLTITGVDDREGYKAVHEARMALKKKRVEITTKGKIVRSMANSFVKAVIAREDEFVDVISPREQEFQVMEDDIDEQKEQIRIAEREEEDRKIQVMSDQLSLVGYAADYITLKGMTEEHFSSTLDEATKAFVEKTQQEQKEREELAEQQRQAEAKRKEEAEANEKERIRLQKIQEEQNQKDREFREEKAKFDREKREHEESVRKEAEEKKRLADLEQAKKEAAEKAIKDKEMADKIAKEEEEQRLLEASESERFKSILSQIQAIAILPVWQTLYESKSKRVNTRANAVMDLLVKAQLLINDGLKVKK
jgi:septal ring factor EnvC (AmiA/AmiB activator)